MRTLFHTLDGGTGVDSAEFSGLRADYAFYQSGQGFTVEDQRGGAPDGTDTLYEVEYLRFQDQYVAAGDVLAAAMPLLLSSYLGASWLTRQPVPAFPGVEGLFGA